MGKTQVGATPLRRQRHDQKPFLERKVAPFPINLNRRALSVDLGTLTSQGAAARGPNTSAYLHSRQKRVLDVTVALVVLLALIPLFMTVAALIRASSKGEVLFRQRRNGQGRQPFVILKFRSMYAVESGDREVPQAKRYDPRVTPIGRFIRKTSIDELPQLVNVLRGEMSLVGPRPHALVHDERFLGEVPGYARRFTGRPGITGLAQVSGERGETPNASKVQARLAYDLQYLQEASLLLDLKILMLTAREMLFSSSSY